MLRRLRSAVLCVVLAGGAMMGVPMRQEEIERLMSDMSRPKVAFVLRDDKDDDEE